MSQRIFKRVAPPEGVAAGQTATVRFPTGVKYHDCAIVTNMALADMTEIRLIANNKVIHRYSATERDTLNQFYGLPAFNGILYIPFDRKALKTRTMEEVTGINTGVRGENGEKISALYLEVDIAAGATTPAMDIFATSSAATPEGVGTVLHVKKNTRNAAGAGELEISDLPFNEPTAAALNAAFFFPKDTNGDPVAISRLVVERGLYKVFERTSDLNDFYLTLGERNPQTGVFAVDFTENGYGANALDLRGFQDFRYRLNVAGAAAVPIVSEYLGILGD